MFQVDNRTGMPDDLSGSLITVTADRRHWQKAFAVWAILVVGFLAAAPFAEVQLPRSNEFVAVVQIILLITNLVTAYLLYGQFAIFGSYAVLALASGYLFAGLASVLYSLSFPGVTTPDGMIGGLQTPPWSYVFWHVGFAAAVATYALLKDRPAAGVQQESAARARGWTLGIVIALAGICMWICVEADTLLPTLFVDPLRITSTAQNYLALSSLAAMVAMIVLWRRRRTVLDAWLLVALWSEMSEPILAAVLNSSRFTVGFYFGRVFSMVTSTIVLAALLANITLLHRKLAQTIYLLQRERNSKMMNIEAVTASIAHEVRQPLATIAANGSAALLLADRSEPDIPEIRAALNAIVQESLDANQVIGSVRSLFKRTDSEPDLIEVNDIIRAAVRIVRAELTENEVSLYTDLASDLPKITGHKGQLQEVVLNLVHNAIDALSGSDDRPRNLRLATAVHDRSHISILIEDSGPGIGLDRIESIFDAFVTSKANGMGLGLAICRMIVERHGGRIWASITAQKGARFTIILPPKYENF
jgi:signal transduction histidine kinase